MQAKARQARHDGLATADQGVAETLDQLACEPGLAE